MPERFLLQPLLLAGLGLAWRPPPAERRAAWKWTACGLFALVLAMGPVLEWSKGDPLVASPVALLLSGPELARMHHPVRAILVAAPLLAVAVALLLDRLPMQVAWFAMIGALLGGEKLAQAVPYGVEAVPPGYEAALWLSQNGTAVVDLTGAGGPALGLAPVHGLPLLEGLRELRPAPQRQAPELRMRADGWLAGESQPGLAESLVEAGFSHVLVIDRGGGVDSVAITADLGEAVYPGVFSLGPAHAD